MYLTIIPFSFILQVNIHRFKRFSSLSKPLHNDSILRIQSLLNISRVYTFSSTSFRQSSKRLAMIARL